MDQVQTANRNRKILRRRRTETAYRSVFSGLGAFILGSGTFMGQALPLGACLISAQPPGIQAFGAASGAIAGYFLRCEPAEAVEYTTVSLLMLFTLFLFQGTELPSYRWFMPLCCSMICAIMGAVRLLGSGEVTILPWIGKAILGAVGTHVFRKAMGERGMCRMLFTGAMVFSLAGVGRYIDLGLLMGTVMSSMMGELLTAAVMGMALDLGGNGISYMTFMMVLPGVVCRVFSIKKTWIKGVVYSILPWGVMMLLGEWSVSQLLSITLGSCIGHIIGRPHAPKPGDGIVEEKDRGEPHEQAAAVLDALRQELPSMPVREGKETEQIYDAVGERVCRTCTRYCYCWEKEGQKTCAELSAAATGILERGIAREEDFPKEFRNRCCAFPAFLGAVNGELEGMLYRRRYDSELRENRRILEQEYRLLAQFLRKERKSWEEGGERRFTPQVSICSARKARERVCGDRSISFMAPDGSYYVILCDGMGTGEEAACLSSYAIRLLEKLLRSGLSPEASMTLLNGNMILRGTGTFSTVDLLRLDLHNGVAYVYKWGAAPSFWRDGDKICKIGSPMPPPGVGIGDGELPETFQLPMKNGQLLVLISDGAYCEETEEVVGAYRASSPRELAAILVSDMEGEDDMTAIVVTLEPHSI